MSVVCVIDDDPAVRDSLGALLTAAGYQTSVFATAEAFLASDGPLQAACAVVDLRIPGMDGIALLNKLRANGHRLPVLVMTGHADVPVAVAAMKAGASDFIEKPVKAETMLGLVRRAVSQPHQGDGLDVHTVEIAARIAALTPREQDLLHHLVQGHANKVIAYELRISPRTVEIHRANLMKKMAAGSISHLVRMALAVGFASNIDEASVI
jgi:two-component system response regulator FixJ